VGAWARLGVIAVLAVLAGCTSRSPRASSTPSATGASASAPASTPTGSPDAAAPGPGSGASSFVGQWQVHGESLGISATTATLTVNLGPCPATAQGLCHETDTLSAGLSPDGTALILRVVGVTYADDSGAAVPDPGPGPPTAVGDTLQLVQVAPGLLRRTVLRGFPGMAGGNPYWCGPGVSPSNAKLCGA
jgi:hypothetical protein